jgi:endoglucanase
VIRKLLRAERHLEQRWRPDAFAKLDWLVSNAASRGIYVIIDMHGVVGGQSNDVVTGRGNQNRYWSDGNAQGNTNWMWWQIANHFKGNPTVAGYDLMNEPMGAPSSQAVWDARIASRCPAVGTCCGS